MSVTDINYTLETTDKATDKDQLVETYDILDILPFDQPSKFLA